jgi:hypothetical protein
MFEKSSCEIVDDGYNRQIAVVKSAGKLKFFSKLLKYKVTFRSGLRLYLDGNSYPDEPGRYILRRVLITGSGTKGLTNARNT